MQNPRGGLPEFDRIANIIALILIAALWQRALTLGQPGSEMEANLWQSIIMLLAAVVTTFVYAVSHVRKRRKPTMSQQTPESRVERSVKVAETENNISVESNVNSKNTTNNYNNGVLILAIVVVFLAPIALTMFPVAQWYRDRDSKQLEISATQTAEAGARHGTATYVAVLALTPTDTPTPLPTFTSTATPTATFTKTPTPTPTPTPSPTPEMAVIAVDQPLARQLILQRVTVYQPAWIGLFLNENCISRKGDNEYVGHSKVEPGSTVDVPVQIHEPQYGRIVDLLKERLALPLTACLLWRQPSEAETSQPIRVRGIPVGITFFVAEAGSNQP